jgi:phosphonate transport system permease protein
MSLLSPRRAQQSRERPRRERPPRARPMRTRLTALAVVVLVAGWSVHATGVGLRSLIAGREGAQNIIGGLFPPDLDSGLLRDLGSAAVQTVEISIASLVLGAVIGLPLAVLMAGNVQAPRWIAAASRLIAMTFRSIHELLWALIFVATIGLGPAAGVFAIGVHSAGVVAKLCSEQLEAVDPAPLEATRLTGGSRMSSALLGVIPQARANLISQLLYQWECNIRSSVVVGFVGAGGIGEALGVALRLFRYQELATLICAVIVIVAVVDRISRAVRARVGAATSSVPGDAPRRRPLLTSGREVS